MSPKSAGRRSWHCNSATSHPISPLKPLQGKLQVPRVAGSSWGVLFTHPKDYTPVCTTELGAAARLRPELDKRGVKVIGLSVDPLDWHEGW